MDNVVRSFDAVAERYAADFADELDRKPFDRDLLDRFDGDCPAGWIADVGCGAAGHVGAYIRQRGRRVFGLDASVTSLRTARGLRPEMDFVGGDIGALPLRDGSLAGVVAFYCLIYGGTEVLERHLRELHRVLIPGGMLVAAAHAGEGAERFDDFQGIPIDVTIELRDPGVFAAVARSAGFEIVDVTVRAPYPDEHQWDRLYGVAAAAP